MMKFLFFSKERWSFGPLNMIYRDLSVFIHFFLHFVSFCLVTVKKVPTAHSPLKLPTAQNSLPSILTVFRDRDPEILIQNLFLFYFFKIG